MGAFVAVVVLIAAAAAFAWLVRGAIGQRGRAIRTERGGKPNGPFIASMVAVVLIVIVLIATHGG